MSNRFMPVASGAILTSGFGPRGGTQHRGADYGRTGGSGGDAVYAAQGGTVVYVGAATGFGGPDPAGWIVIDHPAADGAGTTVYGHIIRDAQIRVGTRVEAGQRIGIINPSQSTNGNVAPHLHFEVHPTVWRAGSQIDPVPWLAGAQWPNEAASNTVQKPETQQVKTIFGVDISNHQNPISCQRIADEGFRFCIIKATEGTWRDPILHSHLADARSTDMHVAAYVYVRGETSAEQHAQALHDHLADTSVPIALDIEHGSGRDPAHWRAIREAIEARGYRVILAYIPEWYWIEVGRPDLTGLPPLWSSRYPSTQSNFASVLFDAAGQRGWQGYGGMPVAVWQFTDRAQVAGQKIDANAFKGTENQLRALFDGETHTIEEELDMSAVQEIKDYIDLRLTGPVGTDVKDIRQQMTGGRDSIPGDLAASYPGWDLGQLVDTARDKKFTGLTLVEMCAVAIAGTDEDLRAARVAAGTEEAPDA